jgi:phage FluMu protein Com
MLQTIKCKCGKTLLEAYSGEIIKICPKCGETLHVLIYSNGVIDLSDKTKQEKDGCHENMQGV